MDWLIHAAVKAVKGRTIAIPWVFFLITGVLTASFNFLLCFVVFFLFGGRKLIGHRVEPGDVDDDGERSGRFEREVQEREQAGTGPKPIAGGAATTAPAEVPELDRDKILTLVGILSLIVVALAFDVDVGFVSFSIAAALMLISPKARKGAVEKVAWSTVLLICGIVMYVGLLEDG